MAQEFSGIRGCKVNQRHPLFEYSHNHKACHGSNELSAV